MNNNQITDIKNKIATFEQIDIDEIFSNIYKNQDIENIRIGQYTIPEYIAIVKRLFKQLKQEIEDNGRFLPFQYNFQNEFGNGNLSNDIQNIINNINSKNVNNFNNTIGFINRLIYYQVINGFWDKSKRKIHKHSEIKISELETQLKFIEEQLKQNANQIKLQINELNRKKEELTQYINQKNQELQQIKNNLQSSINDTSQIADLLNKSTATSEKINGILNQQTQNLERIKKRIDEEIKYFEEQKKAFKTIETQSEEKLVKLEEQISKFNEHLKYVESKREYFEERTNYLNDLIGREVGASLFETFKQRKKELEQPVVKWRRIVIGMAILTFIAIVAIFTNIFGLLGDVPQHIDTFRLITNSIKTLPFFFLLFYSIAQYNKERNFQEDYAFKSAVALTIKAYADIIQKDELKDELIIKSVANVYKSPTIYKTKKTKEDNSIIETAKDLLTTAIEVMKKK